MSYYDGDPWSNHVLNEVKCAECEEYFDDQEGEGNICPPCVTKCYEEGENKVSWISTPMKDISFEHCGRPAYWEEGEVYCSKCQIKLNDNEIVLCGDHIRPVQECGCLL